MKMGKTAWCGSFLILKMIISNLGDNNFKWEGF